MTGEAPVWVYPLEFGQTLSNHDWVPLYLNRLLTSRFVAYSVAEGRRAEAFTAVVLWAESFKQDPAGTLPADDVELAQMARMTRTEWAEARPWALYGWRETLVEGGPPGAGARLGHRVVADVARDLVHRAGQRDSARRAKADAMHRSRVRAKLKACGWRKSMWDNDQIVAMAADYLRTHDLYVTDENVRLAMREAVGFQVVNGGIAADE